MKKAGIRLGLSAASDQLLTLDLLRFVAATAIVVHHMLEFFVVKTDRVAAVQQTWGLALFVDLFFMISGYVIGHVYAGKITGTGSFWRYIQRRIGRLVPLHLLTLVLAIALWALVVRFAASDHQPPFELGCIALTASLLHGIFPCGNGSYFNGVNWSISAEMAMYFTFPLLSMHILRRPRLGLIAALLLISGLIAWNIAVQRHSRDWELLFPPLRALPTFALGVALRANSELLRRLPAPLFATVCLLLASILAAVSGMPAALTLLLLCVTGAFAMATDVQRQAGRLVAKLAPLGQLTYSIYLWHSMFIFVLVNVVADKLFYGSRIVLLTCTFVTLAGTLIWSYISWRWFETPCRRWVERQNWFARSP